MYITSCCREIKSKLHEKMDLSRRAKFTAILSYCDILSSALFVTSVKIIFRSVHDPHDNYRRA